MTHAVVQEVNDYAARRMWTALITETEYVRPIKTAMEPQAVIRMRDA